MRKIHISDSNAKNTFVYFAPIKAPKNPLKAFGKERVFSKRVIISGEQSDYENLLNKYQEKLPEILQDKDPELDLEIIGRPIEKTNTVFIKNIKHLRNIQIFF